MLSAHLAGNVLAGEPPRQNWGKFDAHKWGGFNARSHELHPTQIAAWKREAIEKLAKVFDEKGTAREQNRDAEVTKLHAKIGQLVVERDFLAKAFDR
jgi:hypothetical protein